MKIILALFLSFLLSGCASDQTILRSADVAAHKVSYVKVPVKSNVNVAQAVSPPAASAAPPIPPLAADAAVKRPGRWSKFKAWTRNKFKPASKEQK